MNSKKILLLPKQTKIIATLGSKSNNQLFGKIADLLTEARKYVVTSVNQTIVLTYFEVGRLIVVDEQHGEERAEYGKSVLKELSIRLTKEFGKGYSVRNLEQMRKFYLTYSKTKTLSANSSSEIPQTASAKYEIKKFASLLW
jgi:hypothetical protein